MPAQDTGKRGRSLGWLIRVGGGSIDWGVRMLRSQPMSGLLNDAPDSGRRPAAP